jgi:hypothetical protein
LRTTTDVLRRGLDSTLANWPLIAIRIAENFVFAAIIIGSILAAVVPIAVAAGLSHFDLQKVSDPAQAVAALFIEHWLLVVYILAIMTVVLVLLIAIHSFVEGGSAKVFIDAERAASRIAGPRRESFTVFNAERWMQGGRQSWWSIFWIYNVAWGIGGLIMLIPLLATLAGMLAVSDTGGRVAIGCAGLVITFLVVLPIAVVIAIWTKKAIAVCVAGAATASAALRLARQEIGKDFGRHLAVAFILFAIAFGGAMVISLLTSPLSLAQNRAPLTGLAFAPLQIVASFAQAIFSAAVGLWFLASYVSLTEER